MNYADIALGTWYPMGGMGKIVEGMVQLAEEKGVKFVFDAEVTDIQAHQNKCTELTTTSNQKYAADVVVATADYNHIEQKVLQPQHRHYTPEYWHSRTMAPSSLLFYLGIDKKLDNLTHHTLFFDEDLNDHAIEIYETPKWPTKPLFYVSATSKTDPSVAPQGCENLFVLIPLAPDLQDTEAQREKYYDIVMDRLEKLTQQSIKKHVIYKRSYAHTDFKADYHAYKGNAYGLANTLRQTAILKPTLKSPKLNNLYFAGQLTVPGPGVPPSLISGKVVAQQIMKDHKN
jgi:phytoene desaturase